MGGLVQYKAVYVRVYSISNNTIYSMILYRYRNSYSSLPLRIVLVYSSYRPYHLSVYSFAHVRVRSILNMDPVTVVVKAEAGPDVAGHRSIASRYSM